MRVGVTNLNGSALASTSYGGTASLRGPSAEAAQDGEASSSSSNSSAAPGSSSSGSSGSPGPRTAWNKGVPVPESVRKKISAGVAESWKDPQHRALVSSKLKGKPAWNKGRTLSEETRQKMSAAKMNHTVSKATREKMSASHRGRPKSEAEVALLSERLRGREKSEEHKGRIAAAQRKRHAVARVLRAVEAAYRQSSTGSSDEGGGGGMGHASSYGVGGGGGSAGGGGKRMSRAQILGPFKAELREYRALQEELSTWTNAFVEKHGRKPAMQDVQRTGIPWLVMKYKQYVVLRDRLFSGSSHLRTRLETSIPDMDPSLPGRASSDRMPRGAGATNANGPNSTERTASAARFAAVMDYKRGKKDAAPAGPGAGAGSGSGASSDREASDGEGAGELRELAPLSSQAPPRLRMAMDAAMSYRAAKAKATRTAADAVAVAAKAGAVPPTKAAQLPADVVLAQAAAQRAAQGVEEAAARVRASLKLEADSDTETASDVGE